MQDDTGEKPTTANKDEAKTDVVLLHGRTEDGQGIRALRAREQQLELAELRPLKKGKPLGSAEVVRLRPHKEMPLVCDVDVLYKPEEAGAASEAGHPGPPCVSTPKYRRNWDAIFGGSRAVRAARDRATGERGEPERGVPRRGKHRDTDLN